MDYIIAVVAILMTVPLVLGYRHRTDHSLLYASCSFVVSFVTNIPVIFMPIDTGLSQAVGKHNLLGLVGTLAMVAGVYFLARAVLRASWTADKPGYERTFRAFIFVIMAGMVLSFWNIDTSHSSTAFMAEFGHQPAAALYSMLQFGYIGVVMVVLGVFTAKSARTQVSRLRKTGATLIAAACATAAVMVISVFGMDIANLRGDEETLSIFAAIYSPATVLTMLLLCVGLSLFPAAGHRESRSSATAKSHLLSLLKAVREKLPTVEEDFIALETGQVDIDFRLHRYIVEIQDLLLRDPELAATLTEADMTAIHKAEQQLLTV